MRLYPDLVRKITCSRRIAAKCRVSDLSPVTRLTATCGRLHEFRSEPGVVQSCRRQNPHQNARVLAFVNEVGIAAAMHPAAFAARMPFRESSITIHSSALAPNPRIALSKASGSDFGFEKPDQSTMKSKLFSRPNKERAARRLGGVVEVANAIRYLARAHSTNSGSRNSAVSPVRFRNHFPSGSRKFDNPTSETYDNRKTCQRRRFISCPT